MALPDLHTIGILGGMSSAATGEYYRMINQQVRDTLGGYHIADLLIASVNFGNIEHYVRSGAWEEAGEYLANKARRLEAGGAEAIFLATNTMHQVREAIKSAISIPFVDIFEVCGAEIKRQGKRKVGILGTYPVMTDAFYQEAFRSQRIELVSPDEPRKREIDRILFEEMTHFQFLPASKAYFLETIGLLVENGAEGIILGCTELKMVISEEDTPGIPLFDTTILHCDLAARMCMGQVPIPM